MQTVFDETSKTWSTKVPIGQRILDSLMMFKSNIAEISDDTGAQTTYHEMWLKTVRAAQNLQRMGLGPRQNVCFIVNNSDHVVPVFLASVCLGCPVLPLHTLLEKNEIVRFLGKTKPTAIFCDVSAYSELNGALQELASDARVFIFGENDYGLEKVESIFDETGRENSFVPVNVEDDAMLIMFSSGTTGSSKCIVRPLNVAYTKCTADSVIYSSLSIFWTVGIRPILQSIFNGATRIVSTVHFQADLELKMIEKYKVTILYSVPQRIIVCLKNDAIHTADLSSLKEIITAGGVLSRKCIPEINRYFPNAKITSIYGATEAGIITLTPLNAEVGADGLRLFSGNTAKIIDEKGNRCGPNVSGEICIKCKRIFIGYLDDPKTTEAALDDEGFYRTGDNGHFNESGMLVYEERKVNVMRLYYFESHFMPTEIEDYLISVRDINEVCVTGVPIAGGGVLPAALVIRKLNSQLSQRDIYEMIAENFDNSLRLRAGVYFIDSLPKTHSEKYIRRLVAKMATELFTAAKHTDPDIISYLSDIPDDFRRAGDI